MQLPLLQQTAYQELLQRHRAPEMAWSQGAVMRIEKAGRFFWVSRRREGERVVEESIGPDTPEIRVRAEEMKARAEARKAWSREASAAVATLRAGGCIAPDMATGRLLSAVARTGFFAAGGVLGGTHAFRHYPVELGLQPPGLGHIRTGDVDLIAASTLRLSGGDASLMRRVADFGVELTPIFPMESTSPMKWSVGGVIEVELLSPVGAGGGSSRLHAGLKERVQTLRFLEFSLEKPIDAVSLYRSGVPLKVPAPERYALHKLIVAQLRDGPFRAKREKDLDQAEWLVAALAEARPYELWSAWDDLRRRGPKWRRLAEASLAERQGIAGTLRDVCADFDDEAPAL
jgi:hypothetical protein